MKTIRRIKENKGVSMADVAIAIMIILIFTGMLTTAYYQILRHNIIVRYDAIAINYAVQIAEWIDKIPYEHVTDDLTEEIFYEDGFSDFPEGWDIKITTSEQYSDGDPQQENSLIKSVKIDVEYKVPTKEQSSHYIIQKLKIREMEER